MLSIWSDLARQRQERQQAHLYRRRATVQASRGARCQVDGRELINFCSNDYLGLAQHPALITAAQQACAELGVGSGASHLVCGHTRYHQQLEEAFAAATGRERALLFSTGYMANLGVINALLGPQDVVFEDKLNHASLLDAGLLSGAKFQRFLHNDMAQLEKKLLHTPGRRRLICVDGVYSMDGDIAPIAELARIAQAHDTLLMVDDAHGLGVLGTQGLGCCEGFNQEQVPILMCTLGKALGNFGAIVAGSDLLIDSLIQFARPYIYTTALPPAVAASSLAALQLLSTEPERRLHLQHLIAHFRHEAALLGLPLRPSPTAIQPLMLGDEALALQWQASLHAAGLWVGAMRPPTVPPGTARLRITLTAMHSVADIDTLLTALACLTRQGT